MFDLDKWKEIYAVLSKNKLRTFLTAFGVFWGIFMLILMLGSGQGMNNNIESTMGSYVTNSFFMGARRTSIAYKGYQAGRRVKFNNADIGAIQRVPGVDKVCPRGQLGGHWSNNNVKRKGKIGAFSINADVPAYLDVNPMDILSGRFINEIDMRQKRKVAVIGKTVLAVLFDKKENPIGKYITVKGVSFQVVGVFTSMDDDEESDRNIYIPFSSFQQSFNYQDEVMWFAITSKIDIPVSITEEKVISLMAQRHQVSPKDNRAFWHYNMQKKFDKLSSLFSGIRILIWIIGIGTLLSGIIGISNIMMIIVKERTKEIGICRAIGATPAVIISQILLETLILTFIAGYLGLVAGIGLLELVNHFNLASEYLQNPTVNISIALKALGLLVFSGALAGLLPAYRSVHIKPVDALKSEG